MNKYLLLIALLLNVILTTTAQSNKSLFTATPVSAGFSGERLKRIDNAMNEWVKNEWMNGGVALVARDRKSVV